ncbi:MAG: YciI family protein [Pyrinomonadaceae bacterium]
MTIRLLFLLALALTFSNTAYSQKVDKMPPKVKYDAELAKKLGADERGMKSYVLVILKTGPKDGDVKGKERDDIFAGHMANIGRLADEGKLAVAGPFMQNDKGFRGLYIFNCQTVSEAQNIVETDPAVKSGILIADMTPWYGSASLMATPEIHKTIAKTNP